MQILHQLTYYIFQVTSYILIIYDTYFDLQKHIFDTNKEWKHIQGGSNKIESNTKNSVMHEIKSTT